ncbi:MarR family transcriptional regulator [Ktedonosporobacter rubrisoli]|uniref:MarR family transcriptional regulator n=1 Tax=Ktedonosporobacter rubrisoli TaxID=2509675 RepID=A0A4P6JZZ5_KTERU|nr:MarR family transcriptional regulator [Ktedonosporobacter rubrisoli]QBD81082.1 MarR family transcriptional regulator [Ktedonosporobacter rubrisoli]
MDKNIRQFYDALFDLIGLMNQPQRDSILLREAGVSLDRALFPLLVVIGLRGTVGIMELAGMVGRDHSTVSRQIATLGRLGLVTRLAGTSDRRERKVAATPEGLEIVKALDAARERLMQPILAQWDEQDWKTLVSLLRRFADDASALPGPGKDKKLPQ